MAIGQCVHAALCVAIGAAIGLSAGRVSTALGIVLGMLAAAAGAVVCALWFRRRVSHPVEQITEVTRAIAGGRYGTELPVQRDDELGRLATAINELSQEISRSEKMQSEFISSISHELRTPLTAITGWSETLMFDAAIQGDSRRGISIIAKEAARLTSLVEELLEFTRIQDGRFNLNMELLDIESELEDTIFTYQELLRQDGMQLIYITRPRRRSRSFPATRSVSSRCFSTSSTTPPSMPATGKRLKCPFFRTVKLLPFNSGTTGPASRKTSCRT